MSEGRLFCGICGHTFSEGAKQELAEHMRTHSWLRRLLWRVTGA